jgi:hypothetical protein
MATKQTQAVAETDAAFAARQAQASALAAMLTGGKGTGIPADSGKRLVVLTETGGYSQGLVVSAAFVKTDAPGNLRLSGAAFVSINAHGFKMTVSDALAEGNARLSEDGTRVVFEVSLPLEVKVPVV